MSSGLRMGMMRLLSLFVTLNLAEETIAPQVLYKRRVTPWAHVIQLELERYDCNMYDKVTVLALVSCCVAANPIFLRFEDDGQWRPESDGSYWGRGDIQWSLEDGSWKPELDGSYLGDGSLSWLSRRRRSIALMNPNSLPVPLDEPITAYAKHAQLIQQRTEGARNILGGGIPLSLPADTVEVAVGKRAHAIAHAKQSAITTGVNENFPISVGYLQPWTASAWAPGPWAAEQWAHSLTAPHQYESNFY